MKKLVSALFLLTILSSIACAAEDDFNPNTIANQNKAVAILNSTNKSSVSASITVKH